MRYYEITLPLPVSINAAHTHGGGYRCRKTGKWRGVVARSKEYDAWIQWANAEWALQFPRGLKEMFKGRIRVDYLFVWNEEDRGALSSDIGNREKVLSDFLQKKFFQNDNQIDEQHQVRRITRTRRTCAIIRIVEIPDRRYEDFEGNPAFPQPYRGKNAMK